MNRKLRSRQNETLFGSSKAPMLAPPGYVEGYPRIDFIGLREAVRDRRPLGQFEHPDGASIGTRGYVYAEVRGEQLDLSYFILPFYGEPSRRGQITIKLRDVSLGQGRQRTMMVCPKCGKNVATLVFMKDWACRTDLDLYYHSSAMTRLGRMRKREQELANELSMGRPKGVHEQTIARKIMEWIDIKDFLDQGNRRSVLQKEEMYLINTIWVNPKDSGEYHEHLQLQTSPGFNPAIDRAIEVARRRANRQSRRKTSKTG